MEKRITVDISPAKLPEEHIGLLRAYTETIRALHGDAMANDLSPEDAKKEIEQFYKPITQTEPIYTIYCDDGNAVALKPLQSLKKQFFKQKSPPKIFDLTTVTPRMQSRQDAWNKLRNALYSGAILAYGVSGSDVRALGKGYWDLWQVKECGISDVVCFSSDCAVNDTKNLKSIYGWKIFLDKKKFEACIAHKFNATAVTVIKQREDALDAPPSNKDKDEWIREKVLPLIEGGMKTKKAFAQVKIDHQDALKSYSEDAIKASYYRAKKILTSK